MLRLAFALALSLPLFADDLSIALDRAIEETKKPQTPAAGDALYREKQYESAANSYLEYLLKRPEDSAAWYNLACCLALDDRRAEAISALEQAVKAGYKDVDRLKEDADLDPIRNVKGYKAVVKELEKTSGSKPRVEWIEGTSLQPVYIRKPKDYDSKRSYGLIVILHGRGDTAPHFLENVEDWRGDDFIIAAIETPYVMSLPSGWSGRCWAPWESGKENTAEAYKLSAATVGRAVTELKKRYKVENRKTFLVGFSEGAFMTAHCALMHADKIAGAVVISGGYDPEIVTDEDFAKAKGLRILVAHGTSDGVVAFSSGKKLSDAFQSHGVEREFFPFEGGHQITKPVKDAIYSWLRGNAVPEESKAKEK